MIWHQYQAAFYVHKDEVTAYDISRNFEWNGNLFDEGCKDKKNIKDGIETAITECKKVVNQLDVCIQNAVDEIAKYEKLIADCEAEIARIQAEQAAAALEVEKNKKVS